MGGRPHFGDGLISRIRTKKAGRQYGGNLRNLESQYDGCASSYGCKRNAQGGGKQHQQHQQREQISGEQLVQ